MLAALPASAAPAKPNVLFIAIDDQNDWIGCMGGHPLAKTPHLDALAEQGTLFLNAHCQAPLCNPSRTSLMTGLRSTTTGVYGLAPWFRNVPELKEIVTLPQYFQQGGYKTYCTGKIFHGGRPGKNSPILKEFDVWGPAGGIGVKPPKKLIPPTPMGDHPLMDWGVFPHKDEEKGDYQITSWAVEQLAQAPADESMFLSVGYFLPHVPCYATQKWFDLYPDDDSVLPLTLKSDRDDVPRFAWYLHWELPEPRLQWLEENNQWRNLARSYLACTSFVDAQIGRLIEALKQSGRWDNTVVVVWGDHGYHLGEKGISGKNTLWERSTRVPLIFAGPGIKGGQRCMQPAELLDMYPTLIELCGLPLKHTLEGLSLVPQLKDAEAGRRPAVTSHNQGNHAVRSERYRYIRYADDSEEFYDLKADPHEWKNLASDERCAALIREHRLWLPKKDVPPAPGSAHRVLTYDRERDEAAWINQKTLTIRRGDAVPN
ncbi:MAG: sulfatase [Kiritimatiellae bacterium]|nr:sulfatase [Kiritimatiellia bacterium]